ncbi:PatB family C-S lyase [bacterium]|nr:PatB family C-S lyase [bacterium]
MNTPLDVSLAQLRQRRGTKWTHFDPDVIPSWVADMDFPIAPPIEQALLDILARNDIGYPGDASLQALAEAFVRRMHERFEWQPDVSRVMPVGNLIQALIASVASFSQPGDGVVIQTPIYYPFLSIVDSLDRRLVENPLRRGPDRYEMDLDHLERVIDDKTRLLLFCNPHNPTGRAFERSELEQVAAIAVANDLIVVSDEIHADLVYPGGRHIPLASLGPEIAARTITLTSATKTFNMAGLKCALIHFGSPQLMREQRTLFNEHLLGTPNIMGIEATLAAWRDGDAWLASVLQQLDTNRARVTAFLAEHLPSVIFQPPEAGYLAWLDCSALELSARPHPFFLAEARVAFSDGQQFSEQAKQFVRLNFATAPEVLEQILERSSAAVARQIS